MGTCPSGESSRWGIVLVGNSLGGELSWWGVIRVGVVQWGVFLEPVLTIFSVWDFIPRNHPRAEGVSNTV